MSDHTTEKEQRRNEERMFLAADIRDELAEVSDLPYGDRNRVAWDTVDALYPPGMTTPGEQS